MNPERVEMYPALNLHARRGEEMRGQRRGGVTASA